MLHANTNPMEANASLFTLPAMGGKEQSNAWQKRPSHVMCNGEVLWDSGGEIRIISDTELSRNWTQVFTEAWLSQPYHIQRCLPFPFCYKGYKRNLLQRAQNRKDMYWEIFRLYLKPASLKPIHSASGPEKIVRICCFFTAPLASPPTPTLFLVPSLSLRAV